MNPAHLPYFKYTGPQRLRKAINSLIGLIEGVAIDGVINDAELTFVRSWLAENRVLEKWHPFSELVPVIDTAVADGILSNDERSNILWLCERLRDDDFLDATTSDMQRLHGLMAGIVGDTSISEQELRGLSQWLEDHEHLKTRWPYEEVQSVITSVLQDGRIDPFEHGFLQDFFSEFVALTNSPTIVSPKLEKAGSIMGLCAVCPEIVFDGKRFVLTGASRRYSRDQFGRIVEQLGGVMANSISKKVDYLIIGADGNPCWAYACYGRKIELAVNLRKEGARLLLVHENDFHDAVADYR